MPAAVKDQVLTSPCGKMKQMGRGLSKLKGVEKTLQLLASTRNQAADPKYSLVFTYRPLDNPPVAGTRSASLPELLIASS